MKSFTTAKFLVAAVAAGALSGALSAASAIGQAPGLGDTATPYATDIFQGFDDDDKKIELKEKSWWYSVKGITPEAQFEYLCELDKASDFKGVVKAAEAMVREWPASSLCAKALLMQARAQTRLKDYDDALETCEYLIKFYPGLFSYDKVVKLEYSLAKTMETEDRTFLGVKYASKKDVRRAYEKIARHAPGLDFIPELMLRIAALRIEEQEFSEAVDVYASLIANYPESPEAKEAVYLQAKYMKHMVELHEYNEVRYRNTANFIKLALERMPNHEKAGELKEFMADLNERLEEAAYNKALFYDTHQRTRAAAVAAYEKFLEDFPKSIRADAVKERIEAIKAGAEPLRK